MRFIAMVSLALFMAACAGVEQDCPVTPMGGAECIGAPTAPVMK